MPGNECFLLSCELPINLSFCRFKIAIFYDKSWKAKYVTDTESVNAVMRAFAQAQIIFKWPSLTVPIILNVASITFKDIDIPSDVSGL